MKCQKHEENEAYHSHHENGTVRAKKSEVIYATLSWCFPSPAKQYTASHITNLKVDFAPSAPEPTACSQQCKVENRVHLVGLLLEVPKSGGDPV